MTTEYQQTAIGKIPKDWRVVRLGDKDVCEIRRNKSIGRVENVAFIPMELISEYEIFVKYEMRSWKDVKSFTYCEPGDLLLAKITPCLENGKQGIVPLDIPNGFALATTEVFPISCKGIERLFLFYVLKHPKFRKILEVSMTGTTGRQRVSKKAVEKLLIPLPSSSEQRKIAEVLRSVDEAIQRVDNAIAKTERLKKGLMQKLLTEGIGHKEFKETKIGKIPETWKVVRLGDVITYEKGRKPKKIFDHEVPNSLPYLSAEALRTGEFNNWAKQNGEVVKVNKDDIILIWDGFYCGDVFTEVDGILSSTMIKIKLKTIDLDRLFLFYFLKTRSRELNVKHVGMYLKHVSKRLFTSLKVPLPSLSEQQRIAEILSIVDHKLQLDRKRKEKLERIKNGLMNDLLTGRRRVKVAM